MEQVHDAERFKELQALPLERKIQITQTRIIEFYQTAPTYDGEWKNWNPPKIWVPSKKGLGMKFVFDTFNEVYGKDFMRYE